ncbi:hypothetical protein Kpol_1024p29 [Vanderwaltozyma polyspora DSM 70294]|uniref:COPII coat assembly protein SEC16 n=1 Tax=Vanderwaltozyma polyspora (strain ATCC 22028 / DSM 70294 / BCRC 21397 / CBS 2163 / NBRC 10782 / NRRL Y-8283 / UCD 57-17) TaxID=436907 RepID=A7TLI9_VANPO|nr:uncharacterized protein Kpol_1024p29 [Vanderwaltozyma polyspora DSM 70294]EDO16875.1 hypothetical protein Kpol_1024p29 [Vanderwaltozyma polyspora DSM 70294]
MVRDSKKKKNLRRKAKKQQQKNTGHTNDESQSSVDAATQELVDSSETQDVEDNEQNTSIVEESVTNDNTTPTIPSNTENDITEETVTIDGQCNSNDNEIPTTAVDNTELENNDDDGGDINSPEETHQEISISTDSKPSIAITNLEKIEHNINKDLPIATNNSADTTPVSHNTESILENDKQTSINDLETVETLDGGDSEESKAIRSTTLILNEEDTNETTGVTESVEKGTVDVSYQTINEDNKIDSQSTYSNNIILNNDPSEIGESVSMSLPNDVNSNNVKLDDDADIYSKKEVVQEIETFEIKENETEGKMNDFDEMFGTTNDHDTPDWLNGNNTVESSNVASIESPSVKENDIKQQDRIDFEDSITTNRENDSNENKGDDFFSSLRTADHHSLQNPFISEQQEPVSTIDNITKVDNDIVSDTVATEIPPKVNDNISDPVEELFSNTNKIEKLPWETESMEGNNEAEEAKFDDNNEVVNTENKKENNEVLNKQNNFDFLDNDDDLLDDSTEESDSYLENDDNEQSNFLDSAINAPIPELRKELPSNSILLGKSESMKYSPTQSPIAKTSPLETESPGFQRSRYEPSSTPVQLISDSIPKSVKKSSSKSVQPKIFSTSNESTGILTPQLLTNNGPKLNSAKTIDSSKQIEVAQSLKKEKLKSDAYDFPISMVLQPVKKEHAKPVAIPKSNIPVNDLQTQSPVPTLPTASSIINNTNINIPVNPYASIPTQSKTPVNAIAIDMYSPSTGPTKSPLPSKNTQQIQTPYDASSNTDNSSIPVSTDRYAPMSNISSKSPHPPVRSRKSSPVAPVNNSYISPSLIPNKLNGSIDNKINASLKPIPLVQPANANISPNENYGIPAPYLKSPSLPEPPISLDNGTKLRNPLPISQRKKSSSHAIKADMAAVSLLQTLSKEAPPIPIVPRDPLIKNAESEKITANSNYISGRIDSSLDIPVTSYMPKSEIIESSLKKEDSKESNPINDTIIITEKSDKYNESETAKYSKDTIPDVAIKEEESEATEEEQLAIQEKFEDDKREVVLLEDKVHSINKEIKPLDGADESIQTESPITDDTSNGAVDETETSHGVNDIFIQLEESPLPFCFGENVIESYPGPLDSFKKSKTQLSSWLSVVLENLTTTSTFSVLISLFKIWIDSSNVVQDIIHILSDENKLQEAFDNIEHKKTISESKRDSRILDTNGKDKILKLLLLGKKNEALEFSMENSDFTMALLIANTIDEASRHSVIMSYFENKINPVNTEKKSINMLLLALFQVYSGDGTHLLNIAKENPETKDWYVKNWNSIVLILLKNCDMNAGNISSKPNSHQKVTSFLVGFSNFLRNTGNILPSFIVCLISDMLNSGSENGIEVDMLDSVFGKHTVSSSIISEIYSLIKISKNQNSDEFLLYSSSLECARLFFDIGYHSKALEYVNYFVSIKDRLIANEIFVDTSLEQLKVISELVNPGHSDEWQLKIDKVEVHDKDSIPNIDSTVKTSIIKEDKTSDNFVTKKSLTSIAEEPNKSTIDYQFSKTTDIDVVDPSLEGVDVIDVPDEFVVKDLSFTTTAIDLKPVENQDLDSSREVESSYNEDITVLHRDIRTLANSELNAQSSNDILSELDSPYSPYAPVQSGRKTIANKKLNYMPYMPTNTIIESSRHSSGMLENEPYSSSGLSVYSDSTIAATLQDDITKNELGEIDAMATDQKVNSSKSTGNNGFQSMDEIPESMKKRISSMRDSATATGKLFDPVIKISSWNSNGPKKLQSNELDSNNYDDIVEDESEDEEERELQERKRMEEEMVRKKEEQEMKKREEEAKKEKELEREREKKSKEKQDKEQSKQGGWFKWLKKDPNEKKPIKAKLGHKTTFYYDENLKRWVNKNATEEENQRLDTPPPPPPIVKRKIVEPEPPLNVHMSPSSSVRSQMSIPAGGILETLSPVPQKINVSSGIPSGPASPVAGTVLPPNVTLSGKKASGLDDLLSLSQNPPAGGAKKKKRGGRGYVNVMDTNI